VRLLALLHAFPPLHNAGGEHMVLSMLRPLVERGHDVHVLLSRDWEKNDYTIDGNHVWAYRGKDDPWEHVEKADVVMSHLENPPRATILAGMRKRNRLIARTMGLLRGGATASSPLPLFFSRRNR